MSYVHCRQNDIYLECCFFSPTSVIRTFKNAFSNGVSHTIIRKKSPNLLITRES